MIVSITSQRSDKKELLRSSLGSVLKITLKALIIIVLGICQVQLLLLAFVLSVILVPMDLDVTTKAVVLGSCFLIVSTLSHNVIILRVYCK